MVLSGDGTRFDVVTWVWHKPDQGQRNVQVRPRVLSSRYGCTSSSRCESRVSLNACDGY